MRRNIGNGLILLFFIFLLFREPRASGIPSFSQNFSLLIEKVKLQAIEVLDVKEKINLLTVTNASFTRVGGEETLSILDPIYEQLGCSQGRRNLILLRSVPQHPLYLFFFNREKEKAAYFEINPKLRLENLETKKQEEIFSRIIVTDLSREELFKNPTRWEKRFKEKIFGGNEVRLISISFLWMERLPQEILKAIELHDHLCPGLLSGYSITKFVLDEIPPMESMDYFVIGSPVWCKDDIIQSILNTTPGKRNFVVLPITDKEKEHLKDKNVAGIFLQIDRKGGGGKALVVGFDWKNLEEEAGIRREGFPWEWRLRLALYMARHLKDYQKYIYVIKKFDMEKDEKPETYFSIGMNPWKKMGLWIE